MQVPLLQAADMRDLPLEQLGTKPAADDPNCMYVEKKRMQALGQVVVDQVREIRERDQLLFAQEQKLTAQARRIRELEEKLRHFQLTGLDVQFK